MIFRDAHVRSAATGFKSDANYLFQYLQSKEFQNQIQVSWSYGTQQNIGMNVIEQLYCPVPPLPEQHAIATFLDTETGRIDALIATVSRSIELLKEYRSALISAAVTGAIDVRDAVGTGPGGTLADVDQIP